MRNNRFAGPIESGDVSDPKENLDELFITDEKGRRLFFPFGAFGKARLLRDEAEEKRERERHENMLVHTIWLVGLCGEGAFLIGPWAGKAAFVVGLISAFLAWHSYRLRYLPKVEGVRLSFMGAWRGRARANSYTSLISFAVGSLLFLIVGCWQLTKPEATNFWMGAAAVVVCSFTLAMFCIAIWWKARDCSKPCG